MFLTIEEILSQAKKFSLEEKERVIKEIGIMESMAESYRLGIECGYVRAFNDISLNGGK